MTTDGVIFLGAFFVALGLSLIYTTLTQPTRIARARIVDPLQEVKLARSIPGGDSFAAMAMDIGDMLARLLGADPFDESATAKGQAIVQLLRAADWYWELRPDYKPTPDTPFWSVPTYWSAKGAYTLVYGAIGLVVGSFLGLNLGITWLSAVGLLVGAFLGFLEPDTMLSKAARNRQDSMTIELGFGVPKLHSIVERNPSIVDGVRELIEEPGGPFIEEMTRVMNIYGSARNMTTGLTEMIARNTNDAVREFCTSMRMAVERRGGNLGEALARQSLKARHQMRRYVKQRSIRNKRATAAQTYSYVGLLFFLLLLIPVALIVVQSLGGGSF
jgi:hypothetical protein